MDSGGMIYIASPYSHENNIVKDERFERVVEFTADVMRGGGVAFSPIVHGHSICALTSLPSDFAYWQRQCLSMLSVARVMYVLMLDGWLESIGVQAEIAYAEKNNIPVAYFTADWWEVVS